MATTQQLELKIEQVGTAMERMRTELAIKIEQSKNSLILWFFGLLSAYHGILIAFLGRGFHWW